MDETEKNLPHTSDIHNVLPDVVHSKQIATLESEDKVTEINREDIIQVSQLNPTDLDYVSEAESISEQIPSNVEDSVSESDVGQSQSRDFLRVPIDHEQTQKNASPHLQISNSPSISPSAQQQKQTTSWHYDTEYSDFHISNESPVNLPLSSDTSKELHREKSDSNSYEIESPKSFSDSLNDNVKLNTNSKSSAGNSSTSIKTEADKSLSSEDVIKLDIRGKGAPRFPLESAKIIFGPPPDCATIISSESCTIFPVLTPLTTEAIKIKEIFDSELGNTSEGVIVEEISNQASKETSPDKSLVSDTSEKEQDVLIEEVTIDYVKEKKDDQPKSFIPDETMSFSTMTTDYKTICEEYTVKLVHLEEAINQREQLIADLTISLQQSNNEREHLKHENMHLCSEVQTLQHAVAEHSQSDHDTIKGQLSDFVKYQGMLKDDSTRFYSAVMSGTTSLQSSNGEKDMDREEMTVNHSKSDLKSGSGSEDFQTGFENKLSILLNKFGGFIEDNLRNKLRESLISVLCDEIGKMRLEFETDVRELESQMKQNEQEYTSETRRLRDLLSSVKAGNANIDELRKEYEKEMQDLRTFFEEKCSDIKQRTEGYSEEVWRDRAYVSAGSSEDEIGAGDARRRTRSAELPSSRIETSTPVELTQRQTNKKLEQQLEELKTEHLQYINELQMRHKEEIASLEEQITHLKAHIQTAENTEGNFSFQQDIDSELEKGHVERIREEMIHQLQDQLQVLLSDPDAELTSWPLELVVLRDKIHADKTQENELSSLRDEAVGESDKWRQKRNYSFDQNRQLEEVTKERDGLKRVADALQRAVSQLVAYCASAEDELNRTVLAHLLPKLLPHDSTLEDSRPATPDLSVSLVSRGKHVHFAPDLDSILGSLDEDGVLGFLQQQRDLSAELKLELEHSLKRLRHEAQDLLDLSNKLAINKQNNEQKMLEASEVQISELVEELERKHQRCDNCEMQRKNMEEAMSECLQRENLLRSDLDSAMMKISHLMTLGDRPLSDDIVEGYGTGGVRASSRGTGWCSLDDALSPRHNHHEFEALLKERDDLQQQIKWMTNSPVHKICCNKLEAANRQLKSTRQFVEEQASEREAERDEFAKRLAELREDNSRLSTRLQSNARIMGEVEQLENQTREMNQVIAELETKKAENDKVLKAAAEETVLLRDIIAKLEAQLEQKTVRETEILEQLEEMKRTIDERDSKMRIVLGELESLRSERVDISDVTCVRCAQEEDRYTEYLEKIQEQACWLEEHIHRRTRRLERSHETCSQPTSEPSEDVSIRDQKVRSPDSASPRIERLAELSRVWEGIEALTRAEDAVLKRVKDLEMQRATLNDIAQEVRAERDVLQARMSEQALKISSLSARLQQHRNDAEALAHTASSQLSVQLHDAQAEVQRLKEELESRDKQLSRLKQNLDEKDKLGDSHAAIYGNSCNPKDKVIILERELSTAQARIAQLEDIASQLQVENEKLQNEKKEHQALLLDKEEQLNQIMALKLEEEPNQKSDNVEGKTSGRTLSDIVSISDYDEQDLQMRRAELKNQNASFTGAPRDKLQNKTLPPDVQRPDVSSLDAENVDNFELHTPRADSLPVNFTFTPNKDKFKRNANETTVFGTIDRFGDNVKHSTAQKITDNCSLYPNRNASISNNLSVEPKKINFSLEASDHKSHEFTSLEELGITVDMKQENFPDILSQLKHEVKKSQTELANCKSELKNAEEQLGEFPALKEEVEELKGLLENTVAAMEKDKKFYESQLENFASNKNHLEQKLSELNREVSEKTKDLNLLKEDILRRENMILELAKEKRNLTMKISDLEARINELQNKNSVLEKSESENQQLREKLIELHKLEQLVSEKNQQIDSLNQHLDRLDDLQRRLNDKTDEAATLKVALEKKSKEVFQVQDSILGLNRDITKVVEENDQLNTENKELKLNLSKLEKEQENASLKLQNSESELERVNGINNDLTAKIEELKLLTEQLKDKNTEIEILNEDISSYHNEIAALKEQLKMASRSPSPRSKDGEEKRTGDRQANNDKKQLAKIKKQISLLQYELDFHKKELNDKAFELAKAKLDVTELKSNLSQANKRAAELEVNREQTMSKNEEMEKEVRQLQEEKQHVARQLEMVLARLREEGNIGELKQKLKEKAERCRELESELENMRDVVERLRGGPMSLSVEQRDGARSPTAELERALRQQVHHSRTLDEDIMEQILSASSDEREDIPRLALDSSKSSSVQSSSSERFGRLKASCERLQMQVDNLQARLEDKDALIGELQRIREKLSSECEGLRLREEALGDNSARLQLLLDAQQDTATALQKQDSSMISMLKRRLESAMKSELELRDKEQQLMNRIQHLEARTKDDSNDDRLAVEVENVGRLKGEVRVLKSKLEMERTRYNELQSLIEQIRAQAQREGDARTQMCVQLKTELAELRRLKHETGVELVRAKELLSIQNSAISQLKQELSAVPKLQKPAELDDTRYLMESPRPQIFRTPIPNDEKEHAIRHLQGRCLRLESWRKALVWQKRYLQRVVTGFQEIERSLTPAGHINTPQLSGKRRFRCIVRVVVTVIRMQYLVRRRHHVRSVAAACLLRDVHDAPTPIQTHTPTHAHTYSTPLSKTLTRARALNLGTPIRASPLAAGLVRHDFMDLPREHEENDRRSGFNSPRDARFILSSPRGEAASAYSNRSDAVGRCSGRTSARDVP
ncbi:golgin subfamily A member 4 isoform X4 [Pieris napi]|uniref:golgin subfamily A member 4 isoform X4 n=1 Tax=Pieris napi TaxID=78633 RepID=UPI001FBB7560|nr:golgin subfamily A member 4 isoform X4 [Pieris napi]